RELSEREALDVVALRYPASLLDEITLHIAHQRDRPAESRRAQAKEVEEQLTERAGGEAFGRGLIDRELDGRGGGHDGCHPRFRLKYSYRSSNIADPRSSRDSSSRWPMAIPAISRSTPGVSGRSNFESFRSMSCTISAIGTRARSSRPRRDTR